jgi:glyoxylase I family protein
MPMPSIRGFTHISLSVTDLHQSLRFYRDVLGLTVLEESSEGTVFDGEEAIVLAGRTALCLQAHRTNTASPFDPHRTGLDHVALAIDSLEDLHRAAEHLDVATVKHSGVKPLGDYGSFIELRDPDGIQVELHTLRTS